MPHRNPGLAVGYIRASITSDQELGPEAQRRSLQNYCAKNGLKLAAVYQDLGFSGGLDVDKRPGLLAALAGVKEHNAGVLLIAKRDRLARDAVIAGLVERLISKSGSCVRSADGVANNSGPEGTLMRGMLDVFAQYERALIAARTKAALAVKRSRLELVGDVPLGYRLIGGGKLVPDAGEQRALSRIRELRVAHVPIRKIVEVLNAEGHKARGSRWHITSVGRVLRRTA